MFFSRNHSLWLLFQGQDLIFIHSLVCLQEVYLGADLRTVSLCVVFDRAWSVYYAYSPVLGVALDHFVLSLHQFFLHDHLLRSVDITQVYALNCRHSVSRTARSCHHSPLDWRSSTLDELGRRLYLLLIFASHSILNIGFRQQLRRWRLRQLPLRVLNYYFLKWAIAEVRLLVFWRRLAKRLECLKSLFYLILTLREVFERVNLVRIMHRRQSLRLEERRGG